MDEHEKKALDFISQAEKQLKGGFMSGFFGSGSDRLDEAASLYESAGNAYKMGKHWPQAGDTFDRIAKLSIQKKSNHDAATHYVEAANCYRKCNPKLAIESLRAAIGIYTDMGRFSIAAKHHITLAEIYETDCGDLEQAMKEYETAADFYKGEESNSSANKCLLKVAHFSALLGFYKRAADIFEQIGRSSMENKLLVFGAKDHFFKAAVCQLCIDITNGEKAIQQYADIFPAFVDSREYKLLAKLQTALNEDDSEGYAVALREYDSITRLEPWLTSLFLKVKKTISGEIDLT